MSETDHNASAEPRKAPAPPALPPAKHYVHHRDGEIVGMSFTNCLTLREGAVAIEHDGSVSPHPFTHKVVDGKIVEKTADEQRQARLPALGRAIRDAIARELTKTDRTQVPDYPLTAEQRAAWATYRQALRDLSKRGLGPAEQLAAWPVRPDGGDAVAGMRAKFERPRVDP